MNTNGAIQLATPPEKTAKREVSFDCLVIDANHAQEMFERLIRLLVKQEVKPFQVVDIQRWW